MVRLWKDTETINQNLRENKLIVPKEKGRYVYEILGKWSQGKARCAFLIEVK
jgi:hypothetical protein